MLTTELKMIRRSTNVQERSSLGYCKITGMPMNDRLDPETQRILKRLVPYAEALPGTPVHIEYEKKKLLAMVSSATMKAKSTCQWFTTFSPADTHHDELFIIASADSSACVSNDTFRADDSIAGSSNAAEGAEPRAQHREEDQSGASTGPRADTQSDTNAKWLRERIGWETRRKWRTMSDNLSSADLLKERLPTRAATLRDHPALSARLFKNRQDVLWSKILQGDAQPLGGEVYKSWRRVEFQMRGSPHVHCIVFLKKVDTAADLQPDDIKSKDETRRAKVREAVRNVVTCKLEARRDDDDTDLPPDVEARRTIRTDERSPAWRCMDDKRTYFCAGHPSRKNIADLYDMTDGHRDPSKTHPDFSRYVKWRISTL
jgi:hypothetical protein